MNDLFHYEDLGVSGGQRLVFVETKDRQMPIPSDKSMLGIFARTYPEMNIKTVRRDDVRHSAVLALPAAVSWENVHSLMRDLGLLSGC